MSTATLPFLMPKPVGRKVRRLRLLVRLYVLLDGLAAIVMVLGVAFWLALAIDWSFEPSPGVRGLMFLLIGIATVWTAGRYLIGPLVTRLSDANLALLLERNFPQLSQSVITTVEAADQRRSLHTENRQLIQRTGAEASEKLSGVSLRNVFLLRPLLLKSTVATLLLASIASFALLQSEAFSFWLRRIQLDPQLWPRKVALSVLGFEEIDGQPTVNVARDDDYQLQVTASVQEGHIAPEQVELRYRLADGRRGRDIMTRIGEAVPGRDESQLYRYQFKKVAADMEFDVIGGDDRLRGLRLRLVERPQIFRLVLECEFPEYLQRLPESREVGTRVELAEGTKARCRLVANKPLTSLVVHDPTEQIDLPVELDLEDSTVASFPIAIQKTDRVLLINLYDQDGVSNREPYRFVISPLLDQVPEVAVQLRGIGSAVTPQARIPFAGQVTDDYGLVSTWFEYQVGESSPEQRPLPGQSAGLRELNNPGTFDLAENDPATRRPLVPLEPGQQLILSLKARDAYNLDGQVQEGSSQRFLLDIVTDSELRSLLEKKELALRQRFEAIVEKMTGTRDLLTTVVVEFTEENTPEQSRELERQKLRVAGALQNVVQLSYETLGVADGFEEIISELENNRVDTEELTQRLGQGIAEPLREIGGQLMPQLEEQLQKLQTAVAERANPREALTASQLQADAVLEAMQQVLDRMLELESYNELVELLRGIVADQKSLQEATQQQRRAKLRSLLED